MVEEAVCKNSKKDWRGAAMVKREREMCHLSGGWNGWSVSSRTERDLCRDLEGKRFDGNV